MMSIKIINAVFHSSRARGGDLLVLLALADYADDAGLAFPSLAKLATKCRMSTRNLCYALGKLELLGELKRERSTGGKNRRTRYRIPLTVELSFTETDFSSNDEVGFMQPVKRVSHAKNRHSTVNHNRHSVRKSELPENFLVTDEHRSFALSNALPDPETQIDAFRDFHAAKGNMFADWDAAFRSWLRKAKEFSCSRKPPAKYHAVIPEADKYARFK